MAAVSTVSATKRRAIRAALLEWYDDHRRDLPWRARPGDVADPYRVWLSEIMLQQTTVVHATPYFLEFTRRWPSVTALAEARDDEVMAAWAGLGYYARARNLLACARGVSETHGGVFPSTEAELRKLPGVGGYTAAAIAAIAFGRRANVVDGNVERVVARVFAFDGPLPKAKPGLKALAGELVDDDRPGDWAQTLMDLGSGVCRPRQPLCRTCPILGPCLAVATGDPARYPIKSPAAARPQRRGVAYILRHGDRVALVERPAKGLLGGMRGLPTSPWIGEALGEKDVSAQAPMRGTWRLVGAVEHVFSHFGLTLDVYECEASHLAGGFHWTALDQARSSLPTVFKKVLVLQEPARSARTLARSVSMGARPASVSKCQ